MYADFSTDTSITTYHFTAYVLVLTIIFTTTLQDLRLTRSALRSQINRQTIRKIIVVSSVVQRRVLIINLRCNLISIVIYVRGYFHNFHTIPVLSGSYLIYF